MKNRIEIHRPRLQSVIRGRRIAFGCVWALLLAAASCGNGSAGSSAGDRTDSAAGAIDSMALEDVIAWKASQGLPLYDYEIDSVLDYFRKADAWTKANAHGIRSEADFDSLDARYTRTFPYLELYSMILENNADAITEEQMQSLQATAMSLGATLDSVAKAAGIDPAKVNPLHDNETSTTSDDKTKHQ